MKVLQINSVANTASTGRLSEEIGKVLKMHGHESHIAYGRGNAVSESNLIKIGNDLNNYIHHGYTMLTDKHGWSSTRATKTFIKEVEVLDPDILLLHNLHGYYINLPILFDWIKRKNKPVLWTLFDCWAFTGHCSYFDDIDCEKWKKLCHTCPKSANYPRSLVDGSTKNYKNKRQLFSSVANMQIVAHSQWLGTLIDESFLAEYKVNVIHSGINIELFKPLESNLRERFEIGNKRVILGCANPWSERKGFEEFIKLHEVLSDDKHQIVLIGLSASQVESIPKGIIGLQKTESIQELAEWYSTADVFVNPTFQDNFPTTNLESLACGTPIVTYQTGGSPEAVSENTGRVVAKNDIEGIAKAIDELVQMDSEDLKTHSRQRALEQFNSQVQYLKYLEIMQSMVKNEH